MTCSLQASHLDSIWSSPALPPVSRKVRNITLTLSHPHLSPLHPHLSPSHPLTPSHSHLLTPPQLKSSPNAPVTGKVMTLEDLERELTSSSPPPPHPSHQHTPPPYPPQQYAPQPTRRCTRLKRSGDVRFTVPSPSPHTHTHHTHTHTHTHTHSGPLPPPPGLMRMAPPPLAQVALPMHVSGTSAACERY